MQLHTATPRVFVTLFATVFATVFATWFATACGADGNSTGTTTTSMPSCTVTSVSVIPGTATVPVKQVVQLTAAIVRQNCPGDPPNWSSDAPEVAVVSLTGIVTGVSVGSSKIVASVNGVQGSAVVTVTPCEATGIVLAPAVINIFERDTQSLAVTITPDNCPTATVTWASQENAIATVNTGVVTGVSLGVTAIIATAGTQQASTVVNVQRRPQGAEWDQSYLRVAGGADAAAGPLAAMWAASPTDVFAVSAAGSYRYNGATWTQ